ncbi:26S proteasome non-ATPase regulatory subunit 10-like [Cherax quadricarinatus]|uniref:26S proteasome non-ATPase regulatory subunit 10-like n=1 Tax=Cherax quadricarinatus TaxID=27406 RepID=UPI00387E26AA
MTTIRITNAAAATTTTDNNNFNYISMNQIKMFCGAGKSALHIAAAVGHIDCVKILLAATDPNCQDDDGWTPLHCAASRNHSGVLQVLLNDSRCDPSLPSKVTGRTALHIAVVKGYDDCVKMLLDAGADVNCQDDAGQTPLYYAVRKNNIDIVQMLLNNSRCDPRNKDLTIAAEEGNVDIVKTLLHAGADPNFSEYNGWTPLHCALKNNHAGVVQVLLNDSRCDPNISPGPWIEGISNYADSLTQVLVHLVSVCLTHELVQLTARLGFPDAGATASRLLFGETGVAGCPSAVPRCW